MASRPYTPKTVAYLHDFPVMEIDNPITLVRDGVYNMETLLKSVAEMAEQLMDSVRDTPTDRPLERSWITDRLLQITRLSWITCEERARTAEYIDKCEEVIHVHTQHRSIA